MLPPKLLCIWGGVEVLEKPVLMQCAAWVMKLNYCSIYSLGRYMLAFILVKIQLLFVLLHLCQTIKQLQILIQKLGVYFTVSCSLGHQCDRTGFLVAHSLITQLPTSLDPPWSSEVILLTCKWISGDALLMLLHFSSSTFLQGSFFQRTCPTFMFIVCF